MLTKYLVIIKKKRVKVIVLKSIYIYLTYFYSNIINILLM